MSANEVTDWVVDVQEPQDLEKGLPGYKRRFTFKGDDAPDRAWDCLVNAERHGFKVDVHSAKKIREGRVGGEVDTERSTESG